MAEAAVEERPTQRYYCHMCNVQFYNAADNFTCPHCSDGFIEQLDAENPQDISDPLESDDIMYDVEPEGLMYMAPDDRRMGRRPDHRGRRRYASIHPRHRSALRPRTVTRLASTSLRPNTFDNLLQEFIVNLGVGVNWGPGTNMQVILGNPADYAWGREGLDAIVTQLLNQIDTSGPPPLSKDVIDALPQVEISEEQVISKLQCSVCWEDFQLKETVYQLPCQHVYHETCIRPWLELHGTCPICRQNLGNNDQTNADSDQNSDGASGGGNSTFNTLQQLFQVVQNSSNVNASTSGSTSSFQTSSHSNDASI